MPEKFVFPDFVHPELTSVEADAEQRWQDKKID